MRKAESVYKKGRIIGTQPKTNQKQDRHKRKKRLKRKEEKQETRQIQIGSKTRQRQ